MDWSDTKPREKDEGEQPFFSAIVTCHFEEKSIEEFFAKLSAALEGIGRPYEIIMVNDGSTDGTWTKLKDIFARDPNVRVVMDFFKNAGQQAAVTACVREARGQAIILMDSDLQFDPAELPLLVAEYDKGYDLVSGYRKNRHDSFTRILPSKLANIIMRKASRSTMRDFGCTFKIYRASLLRGFHFNEFHIFSNVEAIAALNRIVEVPVTHYPRKYGKSGWTFGKLWLYNMDNIMLLLQRPFQYLAGICMLLSILFVLRVLTGFFVDVRILSEVTNGLLLNILVVVLLTLCGILAVIGEFCVRSHHRLQRSPGYVIRERLER